MNRLNFETVCETVQVDDVYWVRTDSGWYQFDARGRCLSEVQRNVDQYEVTRDSVWTTRDGRAYFIKDMETQHIRNCIRFLETNNTKRAAFLPIFRAELDIREMKEP